MRQMYFLIGTILIGILISWTNAFGDSVLGENPAREELLSIQESELIEILEDKLLDIEQTGEDFKLRVVYMIPSNRSPQPNAKLVLQNYVLIIQAWFREQMERLGYGPKTFQFEAEADGITPKVNFAYVNEPDTQFHDYSYGARWGKILNGIQNAGFPPWQYGELLLVVAEIHKQLADSSLLGSSVFAGGAGTAFSGVGIVDGSALARFSETFLTDDQLYDGLIIPTIGPYPLLQNVTFPWFEGTTVSSTSSSAQGAACHELGHGLFLPHDLRNDQNFNGNLMGNGLRGIRGAIFPNRYPYNDTRLSSGNALQLNYNRFFNYQKTFFDYTPPNVDILTSGTVIPQNGLCHLTFSASDATSLAGALLLRNGNIVADMPISGNQVEKTIGTYDYQPGSTDEWELLVFDTEGNRTITPKVPLTCATSYNQAPIPRIRISRTRVLVEESITLDATSSYDPDGSPSQLSVEWDLDGDNVFDTEPSTIKTHITSYTKPGIYQIVARLTDGEDSASNSIPIGVRVELNVNGYLTGIPDPSTFSYDPTSVPEGPAGTFFFSAYFCNLSDKIFSELKSRTTVLMNGNVLINRNSGTPARAGSELTFPKTGDFKDSLLTDEECVRVDYEIGLTIKESFKFFVDVYGVKLNI